MMDANTRYWLDEAIAALPDELELVWVHYDDVLSEKQIGFLLEGDMALWDSLWEWESTASDYAVRDYLEDAIGQDRAAIVYDDYEAYDEFRSVCQDRDNSDFLTKIISNTEPIMVRYYMEHDVSSMWGMEDEEADSEAEAIAEVAGIDYETNKTALEALVANASYGGSLCVLHRSDLDDVAKVINGGTVVFTDPMLLVYDGYNGSGHMEEVKGEVTVTIGPNTITHDAGRFSWSDDIAGISHSCADAPAKFIPAPVANS